MDGGSAEAERSEFSADMEREFKKQNESIKIWK
jgi:hypothetical protein